MTTILPPFHFPKGSFVFLTDELHAPADFILHKSLTGHIKDNLNLKKSLDGTNGLPPSIIISASDDQNAWKSIASKLNVNLEQHIASGSVNMIDILELATPEVATDLDRPLLRPVLDVVSTVLHGADVSENSSGLVIIDDISVLEWIGFSLLDITRFTRALYALCSKTGATLIIRHHNVTPNDPDELFRHFLNICTYHLEVRPLYSGRSGAVSGEIALHLGAATKPGQVKLISRSSSLQYRLTDNGPVYFQKGTSEGVL